MADDRPGGIQTPAGTTGRQDHPPRLRPGSPLSDHQRLHGTAMTVKVRFAPSPTGLQHVGNIRTALVNWLFARRHGGHFLLRIDDTDRERSRADFASAVEEDLRWLGLNWDSHARQSERLAAYEAACERLRDSGRLYPAYETPEELEYKRKRQLARARPPVYDRAALGLGNDER